MDTEQDFGKATQGERDRVVRVLEHHDKQALARANAGACGSTVSPASLALREAMRDVLGGKDY